MNNSFYYNLVKNKNKRSAKRKVTFKQTLIIQSPSILSRQGQSSLRYCIRYQITRSYNSPEELLDDDDDNNNDNNN